MDLREGIEHRARRETIEMYRVLKGGKGVQNWEEERRENRVPYTNCVSEVFAPIPTAYARRSRLFQPTGSTAYSWPTSFSSCSTDVVVISVCADEVEKRGFYS
jgi:hypothetical protein